MKLWQLGFIMAAFLAVLFNAQEADGMSTVDIRLDGVSITDDVLYQQTSFHAVANGQPGQAEVVVKNVDQKYAPGDFVMGMTLELYIDGQREWDGWLFDVKRTWPFDVMDTSSPLEVPRFWKLRGFDRNMLFQKRVMYDQNDPDNERGLPVYPEGTMDDTVLLDVYNNYVHTTGLGLSTSGITEIASPSPEGEFKIGYVGAPWGAAFDDCARMTGGVFYIDPDRVIHYRGDTDVNADFALSDTPWDDENSVGYADMMWTKDFSDAATDALVWGAGYGSKFPVFARHENNVDTYGRWQWGDIFMGAYKQATVNKRARTYVEGSPSHHRGHDRPVPSVSLSLYQPGLRCGQVVHILNHVYGFNRNLPVTKLDITFPSPTAPRFDYQLSLRIDEPFSAYDLWQLQDWTREDTPGGDDPPGDREGSGAVEGDLLIDHFDDAGSGCGGVSSFVATAKSTGTSHPITLPDHSAGQTLHLFVVESYPTDGFPISDYLENTLGFTYDNYQSISSPDYNVWSYHKVLTGSEPFFGGTLTLTTPDSQTVLIMATIVSGAVVDSDSGTSYLDVDPPGVSPSWSDANDTAWLTIGISHNDVSEDPHGYANAWDDTLSSVHVRASLKNGTGEAQDPTSYESTASGTYGRAAITVALDGGTFPLVACDTPYVVSSGYYDGSGLLTIKLPTDRTVGQVLMINLVWDGWGVSSIFDPAYALEDSWAKGIGIGQGGYYVGNPDFAQKIVYRFIDGTEDDTITIVPYTYGTGDGNWAAVASVQDFKEDEVASGVLDWYVLSTGSSWSSRTSTAPADGYWRSVIQVLTNSTNLSAVPSNWTLVGTSEVAGEVEVYTFMYDWGYKTAGYEFHNDAAWPSSSAFTNGLDFHVALIEVDAGASSIITSDDVPGPDLVRVTPGPAVTNAPWAGGNNYRASHSTPESTSAEWDSSVMRRRDSSSVLVVWLEDEYRIMYPQASEPELDIGDTVEGYYDDEPASGWSTRYWAAQAGFEAEDGMDLLFKWRYTGGTPPSNLYWRVQATLASIPDDADPTDVWISRNVFYIGESTGAIQSNINFYDTYNTAPQGITYLDDGSFTYPYHAYNGGIDLVEDQWYYTRLKVGVKGGWGYPYVGSGDLEDMYTLGYEMSGIKTWAVGDPEPTDGETAVEWYWANASYAWPGFPTGIVYDVATEGWDVRLPSVWYKNWETHLEDDENAVDYMANSIRISTANEGSGKIEFDGWWRYGEPTVSAGVSTSGVAEIPRFVSSQQSTVPYTSTYETQYPYEPGSLLVVISGTTQGPGQFVETDPASGLFTILDFRDMSSDMYVTYTRSSTVANWTSETPYRPAGVLQYGWGTALDGYNCLMAAGCMGLDRHTLGVKTSTPPTMRSYQYDQSEGTDLADLATAWSNGYGETLEWGTHSWATFLANVRGGRGAMLTGLYANMPANKRFSDTFTGAHAIYINEELSDGYFWGRDPLTSGAVIYSAAELQSYAEGLSWVSAGQVHAGYTQVTS